MSGPPVSRDFHVRAAQLVEVLHRGDCILGCGPTLVLVITAVARATSSESVYFLANCGSSPSAATVRICIVVRNLAWRTAD